MEGNNSSDIDFSSYTVIDIETPNKKNDCICSIAYMYVVDGIVKSQACYLVNPMAEFDNINIKIHGITPKSVKDKPIFNIIWEKIKRYIDGKIIVAHNAIFDLTVLYKTLSKYHIEAPVFLYYFCTMNLAKNLIYKSLATQKNALSLDTLCKQFNISLEYHHDALYDVIACDNLFSKLFEIYGFEPNKVIKKYLPISSKQTNPKEIFLFECDDENDDIPDIPKETLIFDTSCDVTIANSTFCFIGNFLNQTKEELEQKIISLGGIYKKGVSKKVNYIVVGSIGNDQALQQYIENRNAILSPSTIREYKRMHKYFSKKLLETPLKKVSQDMVQKEINFFSNTLSPKSVKNIHGLISAVLKEYNPNMILCTKLSQSKVQKY